MKVKLRNPDRDVEVRGGRRLSEVLSDLRIDPDTVLVIRERELLTRDDRVGHEDRLEIRPVISGGVR
jgi:sulfur carrier protein